jgi:hypothetical protein
VHIAWQPVGGIDEAAGAIVQQQIVRLEFHRECDIDIAVAVRIGRIRVHATPRDGRKPVGRDLDEPRRRRVGQLTGCSSTGRLGMDGLNDGGGCEQHNGRR